MVICVPILVSLSNIYREHDVLSCQYWNPKWPSHPQLNPFTSSKLIHVYYSGWIRFDITRSHADNNNIYDLASPTFRSVGEKTTIRHPLIENAWCLFQITILPGINVTPKTTQTLGKPECENRCLSRLNFPCCGHSPPVYFTVHLYNTS